MGQPRRTMPSDFPAIGPTLTSKDARRHWTAGDDAIIRWHREAGTRPAKYIPPIIVPHGFAELAPTMTRRQLCDHYSRCKVTIDKWLAKTGTKARQLDHSAIMRKAWDTRGRKSKSKSTPGFRGGQKPSPLPGPDGSLHGQAAQYLRHYAIVYRCRETGRADPNGAFWRYGAIVLTPDQLLERATRKGWRWAP